MKPISFFSKRKELKKQERMFYEAVKALVDEVNSQPNENIEVALTENPETVLKVTYLKPDRDER